MKRKIPFDMKVMWYCLFELWLIGFTIVAAWEHDVPGLIVMGFFALTNIVWDYLYFRKVVVQSETNVNLNLNSKEKK